MNPEKQRSRKRADRFREGTEGMSGGKPSMKKTPGELNAIKGENKGEKKKRELVKMCMNLVLTS